MKVIIEGEVKGLDYKVLYRKYRPDNFDGLVGQSHVIQILSNSIKENRIAHAYLFSGPRGTGKTSTARILAKAINCLNNQNGVACNECANCLSFATNPDIIEIDAASNNGVEEIRELINNVKIMPTSLKYKVYIIDEVHMLSQSAFNALLLTLEEPPKHVVFILATTNLESVPITIVSRCQRFEFYKIKDEDLVNTLKSVCEKENIQFDIEGLQEIATLADGGMRDALSILDQLSKNQQKITLDLVSKEIGSISNKKIDELIEAVNGNDVLKIEDLFKEFESINLNYKIVIKKIVYALSSFAVKQLETNENRLSYDDCKNIVMELNELINKVNIYVNPYLLIKLVLLDYVKVDLKGMDSLPKDITKNNEVKEVKNLESNELLSNQINNTKSEVVMVSEKVGKVEKTDADSDITDFVNVRVNNCFVNANKNCLVTMKEKWELFIKEINNIVLKGLVSDTYVVTASDKYLIIVTSIPHYDVELNMNIKTLENEFGNGYKLVFLSEEKWEEEKREYINKKRSSYVYRLIEEKEEIKQENIMENVTDVFDLDKIVVE